MYGSADKNIPAAALGFMAERAHSRKTVVVEGASHVVMTSHPKEVAQLIERGGRGEMKVLASNQVRPCRPGRA